MTATLDKPERTTWRRAARGGMRHHRAWLVATAVVVVLGVIGAVLASTSMAGANASKSRQSFVLSSTAIAATLRLAILHEQDLMSSASGFIANDPAASSQQYRWWGVAVEAQARYPELTGLGYDMMVTAAQLPAFAAHADAGPRGTLSPRGTFQVTPPGKRAYYCFVRASVSYYGPAFPPDEDLCAPGPARNAAMSSRDTGQGTYTPVQLAYTTLLSVQTPVYRGGVHPTTVAGRRAAFLGWVGMAVVPQVLLHQALEGHPHTTVMLRYALGTPLAGTGHPDDHAGSAGVMFRSGDAPVGAQSVAISLHNGWTVTIFAPAVPRGALGDDDALALLAAGIALSLLVGTLMFVLGTGRARALRVVDNQTGELRYQALHDALTGLPNRALIMDRIEQLLARSRRQGTSGAALYVDLDEFKNVNDTLGHGMGDRLLVGVSNRLRNALRDADTIGRMGGDEFVVLIDGAAASPAPELVAERLLDVMRQPFVLDGAAMPLMVNASIGVAIGDRSNPEDLLRDADVALYQAKAAGKNCYEIYDPEMRTEIQQRIEIAFDLRSALAEEQFHLVYQPIYNLEDLRIVGVEALLRWQHPKRGTILPDEFIPVLEQTGQVREVGRWAIAQACTQMAIWHGRGDTLDVSVNLSGRQLDDDAVVDHIAQALRSSGLSPGSLIVEIPETALMRHAEDTARRLQAIKLLGVGIAVDNFGTGYSSLAYLHRFPVDCLKIDRRFTSAITTSPESKALVAALVQLGRDLGLKTLAEGVETVAQMDHFRVEQVHEAQGFLFARPLEPDVLEAQLLAPSRSPGAHRGQVLL